MKLFIDKNQCTQLRNQLLTYKFDSWCRCEQNEAFSEGVIDLLATALEGSGRLIELFYPLYTVAPTQQIKNEILAYAKNIKKERAEELTTTVEVMVLSAILEAKRTDFMKNNRIHIKDITDIINFTLPEREQWTHRTVAEICRRIGFKTTRIRTGTVIIWNKKLIEILKKDIRYSSCFSSLSPTHF